MRDYKGQKFNKLTLLSNIGPGGGTVGRLWMAVCECGNTLQVPGKDAAAGRVRSCGKCPAILTKPRGGYRARSAEDARIRRLLHRTADKALRRGAVFDLSSKDIQELNLSQCFICREDLRINTLSLEPVDSVRGYTAHNIQPICGTCRRHMAGSNLVEFLEYIQRIK